MDLIECAELEMHKDSIQHRMNEAVLPMHYLANVMNPKYVRQCLSPGQENLAASWMTSKHPEWFVPFLALKIKDK